MKHVWILYEDHGDGLVEKLVALTQEDAEDWSQSPKRIAKLFEVHRAPK